MSQDNKKLVFATNNSHKLDEVREIIGDRFSIMSLNDIGCHDDIPENEDSIRGNALAKARYIRDRYGCDCFADDTGLEVDALDGMPGVHTARYASDSDHDSQANMRKLLENMKNITGERTARFRTVIALVLDGAEHIFEGIAEGGIAVAPRGEGGFGYDPVFIPKGFDITFAEMPAENKNAISHRALATKKLIDFLNNRQNLGKS